VEWASSFDRIITSRSDYALAGLVTSYPRVTWSSNTWPIGGLATAAIVQPWN